MAISSDTQVRLAEALTLISAGNEVSSALNNSEALVSQSPWVLPAAIVATNVSQTINFAALKVGDYIAHVPAVAGSAQFLQCAVAGTLPVAAVVGDLYLVIRAAVLPPAADIIL